jgi:transcriptional regulator with XRE-family HTH domain
VSTKTNKPKYQNHLLHYRSRMQFTKEYVARLLGHKSARTVARLEGGYNLPGVSTLFRLSAILRVPTEFQYQDVYMEVRKDIRNREEQMPVGQQGVLPLLMR